MVGHRPGPHPGASSRPHPHATGFDTSCSSTPSSSAARPARWCCSTPARCRAFSASLDPQAFARSAGQMDRSQRQDPGLVAGGPAGIAASPSADLTPAGARPRCEPLARSLPRRRRPAARQIHAGCRRSGQISIAFAPRHADARPSASSLFAAGVLRRRRGHAAGRAPSHGRGMAGVPGHGGYRARWPATQPRASCWLPGPSTGGSSCAAALGFALRSHVDGLSARVPRADRQSSRCRRRSYSIKYLEHYPDYSVARYYPYFLLFLAAMYGLVSTTDMMWFFFIFWQMMTLPGYALIRFESRKPANLRAAERSISS